jgi:hypothetical protein
MPYTIATRQHPTYNGTVTRRAVATLDEAREAIVAAGRIPPSGHVYPAALMAAESLPESGGRVGPLPDGTVIEVRFASWQQLGSLMGTAHAVIDNLLDDNAHGEIIDAYNAAQRPPVEFDAQHGHAGYCPQCEKQVWPSSRCPSPIR